MTKSTRNRRRRGVADPATLDVDAELDRRHRCLWIDAHRYGVEINGQWRDQVSYRRCPRQTRTGENCWCRVAVASADSDWPYRVVPPLKDVGGE